MEYSYNDYLKQKENKTPKAMKTNVGYFKLSNDKDEAIVRFVYDDVSQFNLVHVHSINIDGMYRRISCIRSPFDPIEKCPLCNSGERLFSKFYVKLIEYTKDENGNIVIVPKVWERPESFASVLATYLQEYGDLKDCVFKIIREGAKNDLKTTYQVMLQNPMKYREEDGFKKDFSAFNNFDLAHHSYKNKTKEELEEYVKTGVMPMQVTNTEKEMQSTTKDTNQEQVFVQRPVFNNTQETPVYPKVQEQESPLVSRPRRTYEYNQ